MILRRRCRCLLHLVILAATLIWAVPQSLAQNGNGKAVSGQKAKGKVTRDQVYVEKFKRIAPSQQKTAAKRAAKLGLKPGIAGLTSIGVAAAYSDPGVPHYFGPYGNWAFSPLPKGPIATVTVVDGGTGYIAPPRSPSTMRTSGSDITPATVTATVGGRLITGFTIGNPGEGYTAPVVNITDGGHGALADAMIGGPRTGGMRKFVDTSARAWSCGCKQLGQYIPVAVGEACTYQRSGGGLHDRPRRVRGEDAHGPAGDKAPGLRATVDGDCSWRTLLNPAAASMMPDGTPRRMVWTSPITSGPSSWPRAR